MTSRNIVLLALLSAIPFPAGAAPALVRHEGLLLDAGGLPLDGTRVVKFAIYDEPRGGTPLWTEELPLKLVDGHFEVLLGASSDLPGIFTGEERWLGLAVDQGAERTPRHAVTLVQRAGAPRKGAGPAAAAAWALEQSPSSRVVVLADGNLSVGALRSEPLAPSGRGQAAAGCDDDVQVVEPAASLGGLPVGGPPTGGSRQFLEVAGAGPATGPAQGPASQPGGGVPGEQTQTSPPAPPPPPGAGASAAGQVGGSPETAGTSCKAILDAGAAHADGMYWVRPAGAADAFQAYCDMTTDGGGYTLLRIDDPTLGKTQQAYRDRCARQGLEVVVPRTKAHALAIQAFNRGTAPNLVNVFPKRKGAKGLKGWVGRCQSQACSFWLSDGNSAGCKFFEPNGDNDLRNALYRSAEGCDYGQWNDAHGTMAITGWVICSTNDK